jgi:hypothetical protein
LTNITAAQVGALSTNAGALIKANNLSELSSTAAMARSNLGLGLIEARFSFVLG